MAANLSFTAVLAVLLFNACCSAKIFEICEFASILAKNNFPVEQLPDWVCLAQSESSLNSTAIGGPNKNGSYDNGIFQINDTWWCDYGKPGKDCNVACEDLTSDDITESMKCAKKIYKRQGFAAWHGWTKKCKDKTLPDLSKCNM